MTHAIDTTETDLQSRCSRMVQQEVMCCLSSMVATLAQGGAYLENPERMRARLKDEGAELSELCEQALELASSIPDYEEAAIQEGWKIEETTREGSDAWYAYRIVDGAKQTCGQFDTQEEAWRDCCETNNIDPYDREVYEHWAVSDWLAEKLTAAGQKVDDDFAGLNVWARTTTGQSISMDGVIRKIVRSSGFAGGK